MGLFPKDTKERKYIMLGFKIMGDFGISIAAPVVIFVLSAQWLEAKYGHGPYITIFAFLLAAMLSAKMIHKKAKQYGRDYQEIEKTEIKKE
jgi:uncharacterized membrane protein YagU involved in acid resistance